MQFELNHLPYNCSDKMIQEEIHRVVSIIQDKAVTRKKFDTLGKISSGRIMKKYNLTWKEILEKNGLCDRYGGLTVSIKMKTQLAKKYSNEDLSNEIKRVSKLLATTSLSQKDFNNNSEINAAVIYRRFGSWKKALENAGLRPKWESISEIEYFENLLKVWTYYGRQPKSREMDLQPSNIKARSYESRFKKWSNALEAFIEYANIENVTSQAPERNEEVNNTLIINKKNELYDRRTISLGLRYAVLSRDKFKCVKCGKSPATNQNCTLHIDHIVPWSKGGKTIIGNLQTTCEECNLGKGNRYEE